MWVLDLLDKEKRRTRYFVSSQKWRVLWLEYEDTPPGGAKPVKYKRTFHDYRYAQGQLVPYRTVLYADGKQLEESQVINVSYGSPDGRSYFRKSRRPRLPAIDKRRRRRAVGALFPCRSTANPPFAGARFRRRLVRC